EQRDVVEFGALLQRPLGENADFLFRDPIRIDGLERRPVGDGAVNLAALHREMDFGRALVAGDDLEFESEQLVGEHGIVTGSSPALARPSRSPCSWYPRAPARARCARRTWPASRDWCCRAN